MFHKQTLFCRKGFEYFHWRIRNYTIIAYGSQPRPQREARRLPSPASHAPVEHSSTAPNSGAMDQFGGAPSERGLALVAVLSRVLQQLVATNDEVSRSFVASINNFHRWTEAWRGTSHNSLSRTATACNHDSGILRTVWVTLVSLRQRLNGLTAFCATRPVAPSVSC